MDSFSRRRHLRLPLKLPVRFQLREHPHCTFEGSTENLSDSGLMLLAPDPLPLGSAVTLQLLCSERECQLEGAVVWSQRLETGRIQSGIQFLLSPGDGFAYQLFIREFVTVDQAKI